MSKHNYGGFYKRAHNFFSQLFKKVDLQNPSQRVLRQHFITEVKKHLPLSASDEQRLKKAFNFSFKEHRLTQKRDSGEAYIFHPIRCTLVIVWAQALYGVYDLEVILDMLLHDCFEEAVGGIKVQLIVRSKVEMYFGHERAFDTLCLTKQKERCETNTMNFERILRCGLWRVPFAKVVDRTDNVFTIGAVSSDRRERKLAETEHWFGAIGDKLHDLLEKETDSGRLKPPRAWINLAEFLIGYLQYAVKEERGKRKSSHVPQC